ncbi:uncharacterized protein LOC110177881 [Drosophila serrata]|uniref:uncharacterized protein LOC110177881 n=1 Tax=Drosophila serrata TaxID=7274 RepID=UPI000A1D223D|nr:uncharacterized protein LOC110177881 [Drosophila serrata]
MSRLSVVRGLPCGFLRRGHLYLGCRHKFRCLSDDTDSSSDLVQSKLKRVEMKKPLAQPNYHYVWPEVYSSEDNEMTDDGFTATWNFKNNELDVEQLAGLPSPNEADDPYSYSEYEEETTEEEEHQKFQEELQFGRMLALREQLNRELSSSESFTTDERNSLASVKENVDFMMEELSQISFMLKALYPEQCNATAYSAADSMVEEDCVMGRAYSEPQMASWVYTNPKLNPNQANADVYDVEEKEDVTIEAQMESESPVMTTEVEEVPKEELLSYEQEPEALDEVTAADDSPKSTPAAPAKSTPTPTPNPNPNLYPNRVVRHDPQPQETIHTYKPFRTIEVPAPKTSQSHYSQANEGEVPIQEELTVAGRNENSPITEGFKFSTQLSEAESRYLMHLVLKQALHDLESGKTKYQATLMMADDEESHGVD